MHVTDLNNSIATLNNNNNKNNPAETDVFCRRQTKKGISM